MAKGKYAARAANRLAQTDNEIIVGLREKLAALETERDALTNELADIKATINSRVLAGTATATESERQRLAEESVTRQSQMEETLKGAAYEVADVLIDITRMLREHFDAADIRFPSAIINDQASEYPSLVRMFAVLGVGTEAGSLLESILEAADTFKGDKGARRRRRRTVGRLQSDLRFNRSRSFKRDLVNNMKVANGGADVQEA